MQSKWPKSWSYSADGFIHPGQLALYRPSVPLSDYRFEFMAQIESKSVDWVVRAKDADNYYALKFTVLQPGPRPLVAMTRSRTSPREVNWIDLLKYTKSTMYSAFG